MIIDWLSSTKALFERRGIEYVEDYALNKRVPTINRVQYTSIFDDSNSLILEENGDIHVKGLLL